MIRMLERKDLQLELFREAEVAQGCSYEKSPHSIMEAKETHRKLEH